MSEPTDVVNAFNDAIATGDLDAILACFTPDAIYHNIPMEAVQGVDAIRATLESFMAPGTKVTFEVLHQTATGNIVMNERIDRFVTEAKTMEIPVAGVFEIVDGKIAAWRDYFDLNMFMSQLA